MSRMSLWTACALVASAVFAACSASSAASSSSRASTAQVSSSKNKPIPNVCDGKIVTPDDLASVMAGKITATTLAGDPQTCEYASDRGARVSITARPGLGDITVTQWANGGVPVDYTVVNGIGDRARWQSTLHELITTKHNVLCDIGADGVAASEKDLQEKFGQLCDKIWAAQ